MGKANALNKLSNLYQDNSFLREAVQIYERLLLDKQMMIDDDQLYEKVGVICVDRMTFLGKRCNSKKRSFSDLTVVINDHYGGKGRSIRLNEPSPFSHGVINDLHI